MFARQDFSNLEVKSYCGRGKNVSHNPGIPVILRWDSCGTQLGFLWYSVGIPVVLKGDLLWY